MYKKKTILVICPHPLGRVPGQRLKFEQYYDNWRKEGFDIEIAPFMNNHFQDIVYKKGKFLRKFWLTVIAYFKRLLLLFQIRNFDIVYVFLWVTPFGPPFFEKIVRFLAKTMVYDIDDLVYLNKSSPANKFISIFKSSKKIFYSIKYADHVFVSTKKLFDTVYELNKNISFIPATIDLSTYPERILSRENKKIIIGWSGSHTTSKYIHLLDDVLKVISNRFDVLIHIMGDPEFQIEGLDNITLINWSPQNEIPALQQFDIGLHPVPDEEWTLGKSGGKLVQYMAAAVPIIATRNEPNSLAIQDGISGFLVTSDEEWIEKMALLISDSNLRLEMANKSYERAISNYSTRVYANEYISVFNRYVSNKS